MVMFEFLIKKILRMGGEGGEELHRIKCTDCLEN